VHSQAILRIVEPKDAVTEDVADAADEAAGSDQTPSIETAEETRARLERDADDK
jgi:preprotein translocase subunit YajC